MVKETYLCNECGAERKEANHWWVVCLTIISGKIESVVLYAWPKGRNSQEHAAVYHYCGQKCTGKALDRFMSTGKIEK